MYIYSQNDCLWFDLACDEKAALYDIVKRAHFCAPFYKNVTDAEEKQFYTADSVLYNCYFTDFMEYASESIIWALHVILKNYFSATNYHDILNHPLYAFFCELDKYLYASNEA